MQYFTFCSLLVFGWRQYKLLIHIWQLLHKMYVIHILDQVSGILIVQWLELCATNLQLLAFNPIYNNSSSSILYSALFNRRRLTVKTQLKHYSELI